MAAKKKEPKARDPQTGAPGELVITGGSPPVMAENMTSTASLAAAVQPLEPKCEDNGDGTTCVNLKQDVIINGVLYSRGENRMVPTDAFEVWGKARA